MGSVFTLFCPLKMIRQEAVLTIARVPRGGEAKGGGLDPMALSASPPLPPACHRHQMTRGEWQLHANSGARGARQRGVVASSDKILQQLHLRWGWGGGACDTRRRHVTHDMQTLSLHHAFIVEATLQLCYQDITDGLVDTDVASCVALYCGGNLYWRFALALLRVVRLSETLIIYTFI